MAKDILELLQDEIETFGDGGEIAIGILQQAIDEISHLRKQLANADARAGEERHRKDIWYQSMVRCRAALRTAEAELPL